MLSMMPRLIQVSLTRNTLKSSGIGDSAGTSIIRKQNGLRRNIFLLLDL